MKKGCFCFRKARMAKKTYFFNQKCNFGPKRNFWAKKRRLRQAASRGKLSFSSRNNILACGNRPAGGNGFEQKYIFLEHYFWLKKKTCGKPPAEENCLFPRKRYFWPKKKSACAKPPAEENSLFHEKRKF